MNSIVIYQAENGTTSLSVHLDQETVWLSQEQMADLFVQKLHILPQTVKTTTQPPTTST